MSEETLEWLEWYNQLNEAERLAVSYIPSELFESSDYYVEVDIPVETE